MLSQEEIRIKAGLDYSKVTAGLTDMKTKVGKFVGDIKTQFVGMFAAGAVIGQLKQTIDWVEQLAQRADALGVSKSFLQDLENIGTAAGKSSEQMQQLLTKFALKVPAGANIQDEFMKFLDQIAATKDPAERAALAFDRLGKSGILLLDVAKDGSKAFKELSSSFSKLSDVEINSVLKADAILDKFSNRLKIYGAKLIAWFDRLERWGNRESSGMGEWEHMEQEDRIAEMDKLLKEKQLARQLKIIQARELAVVAATNEVNQQERLNNKIKEQIKLQNEAAESRPQAGDSTGGQKPYSPGFFYGKKVREFYLGEKGMMVRDRIKYLGPGEGPSGEKPKTGVDAYLAAAEDRRKKWQHHVDKISGRGAPQAAVEPPTGTPDNPLMVVIQDVK